MRSKKGQAIAIAIIAFLIFLIVLALLPPVREVFFTMLDKIFGGGKVAQTVANATQ